MANPVCISPLKFYDDSSKQDYRKSYAYNHISPVITKLQFIPAFQFVIPNNLYTAGGDLSQACLVDAKTDEIVENITNELFDTGFSIIDRNGYKVAIYFGQLPIQFNYEGQFYLTLSSAHGGIWKYYSEVFCFTNTTADCIEIEYWNGGNSNFYIKNGIIAFPDNFHFKLLLKTELGKPEYSFEEESTKRMGYSFIENQVSKKSYKFNVVVPEFICDAMRLIRLCSNKIIKTPLSDEYEAITFEMDVDWQVQGNLASVTCEFETDNIIANLGGFVSPLAGGDYNGDYNGDFDNQ